MSFLCRGSDDRGPVSSREHRPVGRSAQSGKGDARAPSWRKGHLKGVWLRAAEGQATPVKRLTKTTLLNLLQLYESVIRELEALRDPGVAGLLRRMERHRAEVIAALAEQGA
jgi:hypothetical protein